MKIRNVLTLFNGISACHLSLIKSNIIIDKLYYAEIDKYANSITSKHFPDDILLGDVLNWESWDIDWSSIDLVVAGFPCQAWSSAGNQLGDKDPRGKLFWTTLDIISKVLENNKNAKYMMENVKMKSEFEKYITLNTIEKLGEVNKIMINSALLTAQNRERYYWSNFNITQPKDKNLFIKDINKNIIDLEINDDIINKIKNGEIKCRQKLNGISQTLDRSLKNIRKPNQKAKTLTATSYKGLGTNGSTNVFEMVDDEIVFRQLNENESELIQSFPINWTEGISRTQRLKSLGNAWTVDIISHIFDCMIKDIESVEDLFNGDD